MAVDPIPEGYPTVTPTLVYDGAADLLDFYAKAFGAKERMRAGTPDGKIMHSETEIGGSMIMINDPMGPWQPAPASFYMMSMDVDATYKTAVAAGATSEAEPEDQFYGDRTATVIDPAGNRWVIATHVEDVSEEEMAKRQAAFFGG